MSLSETMKAMADPSRRKILELLKRGELPVGAILTHFDMTGASLSHHLAVLKRADLIAARREGQQIICSLNLSVIEELIGDLAKFLGRKRL